MQDSAGLSQESGSSSPATVNEYIHSHGFYHGDMIVQALDTSDWLTLNRGNVLVGKEHKYCFIDMGIVDSRDGRTDAEQLAIEKAMLVKFRRRQPSPPKKRRPREVFRDRSVRQPNFGK